MAARIRHLEERRANLENAHAELEAGELVKRARVPAKTEARRQ